jgi:hypothetical protein
MEMATIDYRPYFWAAVICAVLAMVFLPPLAEPVRAQLPPRPSPTPTPTCPPSAPRPEEPKGGKVELALQFPETISYAWQELWTVVQWQDPYTGKWRDVAGWQGTFDGVKDGVGRKNWWVASGDLGTGPFRWRIYRSKGGKLLATSEEFTLPERVNTAVRVEVSLVP